MCRLYCVGVSRKRWLNTKLDNIYAHRSVVDAISKLENNNFSTVEQIKILETVESQILPNNDYSIKFSRILPRNPNLNYFRKFNILKCSKNEWIFAFVPLVSAGVERCFSVYKDLLADDRKSLSQENLQKCLFLHFNSLISNFKNCRIFAVKKPIFFLFFCRFFPSPTHK